MKHRKKESADHEEVSDRNLLSHVQSPDDLEIGSVVKERSKGSRKQLVNEESPDDMEIYNGHKK